MVYGGAKQDEANAIAQAPDGGFVLTGFTDTWDAGKRDAVLLRTDPCGNPLWLRTFGGDDLEEGHDVIATSDGGFVLTGASYTFAGILVVKVDGQGEVQWSGNYGGTKYEFGRKIRELKGGGCVVAGETRSFGFAPGEQHARLVARPGADGRHGWMRTYSGGGQDGDGAFGITEVLGDSGVSLGTGTFGATATVPGQATCGWPRRTPQARRAARPTP